jgi:hypothetical protein
MPPPYNAKRRIGSIRTVAFEGAPSFLLFRQNDDEFLWATPLNEGIAAVAVTTDPTLFSLSVPTGLKVNALFRAFLDNTKPTVGITFGSPDAAPSKWNTPPGNASLQNNANGAAGEFNIRTSTNAQIFVAGSAATTLYVSTTGWIDSRGK